MTIAQAAFALLIIWSLGATLAYVDKYRELRKANNRIHHLEQLRMLAN